MKQTIEPNDIVEMIGNLSKDLKTMVKPRLATVVAVNGAHILVWPEGKTYSVDFLDNEVKFYKKGEPKPLKEQGERSGVKTARMFLADNLHIDESDVELRQLRAMKQYGEQVAFQVRDECSKATDIVIMINISQFIK